MNRNTTLQVKETTDRALPVIRYRLRKAFPELTKLCQVLNLAFEEGLPSDRVFNDYFDRLGDSTFRHLVQEIDYIFQMGWGHVQFDLVVCDILGLTRDRPEAEVSTAYHFLEHLQQLAHGLPRYAATSAAAREPRR